MFRGSSFHTIDAKGRVIIPARFRDIIKAGGGEGVMLTKLDGGLFAYTYEQWASVENRIMSQAEKSSSMRTFRRVFVGGAFECAFDKQHRILIPPSLRSDASLKKEIVIVGVLDHFEIWSRSGWDSENEKMEEDMLQEDVRSEIAGLGL